MKILGVRWFCAHDFVIGIVRVDLEYEGIKYFIGTGKGLDENQDIGWIARWGMPFPTNVGDLLFGIETKKEEVRI